MADAAGIGAATIALSQTPYAYSFFLPKLSEVRRAEPDDPLMRGDVLLGQIAAGALSIAVGGLLSWMTGSQLPVLTSIFIAAVIAGIYQYALNGA